jgi:hypothetical protein
MGASVLVLGGLRRRKAILFINACHLLEHRLSTLDCIMPTSALVHADVNDAVAPAVQASDLGVAVVNGMTVDGLEGVSVTEAQ